MKKTYWFIFYNDKLLLAKRGQDYSVPFCAQSPLPSPKKGVYSAGEFKKYPCKTFAVKNAAAPAGCEFTDLRSSYNLLPERLFWQAGRASQIIYWDANSRFCSFCGAKPKPLAAHSKVCPVCGKEIYPFIAVAAMVLVKKGDKILMIRGRNFKRKYYGLVAGFLETGETLEQCAAREVMEETNIKIKNIKYFASQPWPFPSGLMVGFWADYAGGKLKVNKEELSEAVFFDADSLPPRPGKISLARRMTDAWLKTRAKDA